MPLFIVPEKPADATPLERALEIAEGLADPAHRVAHLPIHDSGREVGVLTACVCGWEIVRPSAADAAVEVALHRATAPALAAPGAGEGVAAA
ncbi:hypothetical protein [Nocardiopsis potens]|uniref:hypothetical protein n=1 Tax=Nocardiopsis potens TaxID=1246458 RepID=UPI0003457BA6|nr:hypothetical protein [Nocardiopsis potens]